MSEFYNRLVVTMIFATVLLCGPPAASQDADGRVQAFLDHVRAPWFNNVYFRGEWLSDTESRTIELEQGTVTTMGQTPFEFWKKDVVYYFKRPAGESKTFHRYFDGEKTLTIVAPSSKPAQRRDEESYVAIGTARYFAILFNITGATAWKNRLEVASYDAKNDVLQLSHTEFSTFEVRVRFETHVIGNEELAVPIRIETRVDRVQRTVYEYTDWTKFAQAGKQLFPETTILTNYDAEIGTASSRNTIRLQEVKTTGVELPEFPYR